MHSSEFSVVEPQDLKAWLHDDAEIALLDVREAGQFGEGHLFLATPLPYSRLEIEVERLVPRRTARIVLVDDTGAEVAYKAARRLAVLGYTAVHVLEGGMTAWAAAGMEVFAGVNVPSKAFGELAELHFGTPHISAVDLAAKIERGEELLILDGRPVQEYRKMSIPTAMCCPNGELSRRIDDLVQDPDRPVIINCAGRTRSIVGAQTLINLGISNPVYALENGTQGWYLSDLELDHGASRLFSAVEQSSGLEARVERAQHLADRYKIQRITADKLMNWLADAARTTYLCDVRTPEESEHKPIMHAQSTPGGQLIQATDQYVATRGARVVLVDDDDIRAPVVATWLYMLGWDVYVLPAGEVEYLTSTGVESPEVCSRKSRCEVVSAQEVLSYQSRNIPILDVRPGMQFRQLHIAGAIWSIRPILQQSLASAGVSPETVLLVSPDRAVAELVACDLREMGVGRILVCEEDVDAWKSAGLQLEATPTKPSDTECIDYLFFVHDRHDGNKQAAQQYLAWETNLISQLDHQEKAIFRFKPQS